MTCEATANDYAGRAAALLPPGPAWAVEEGNTLAALLLGISSQHADAHNRACALTREVNPASTVEMLPDWERVAGLPDSCAVEGATMAERRNALVAKLASTGGQSAAYYARLAASFGYTINVVEYRPFRAGMAVAGAALTNDGGGDGTAESAWTHWWRVETDAGTVTYFGAGIGAAGEPLARFGDDLLECVINRHKPSHTGLIFSYL